MGLKSGSRDADLEQDEDQESEEQDSSAPNEQSSNQQTNAERYTEKTESMTEDATADPSRPTIDSLPYKLRREKVNEGREQVPFFLRKKVIDAEPQLQDDLKELLGEDVYKSDYREAAMVVAQRNPELVADVLREWGYDLNPR